MKFKSLHALKYVIKAGKVLERVLRRNIYKYTCETSEDEYKDWKKKPNEDFVIDVSYSVPTYVCAYHIFTVCRWQYLRTR